MSTTQTCHCTTDACPHCRPTASELFARVFAGEGDVASIYHMMVEEEAFVALDDSDLSPSNRDRLAASLRAEFARLAYREQIERRYTAALEAAHVQRIAALAHLEACPLEAEPIEC